MEVNKDYKFRDDLVKSKEDTVPIEILIDPYKGVVYRYTAVGAKVLKEDVQAVLQFKYDILDPGIFSETTLRKDKYFERHIGLILNTLILEVAEAPDVGEDDPKESGKE